MIKIKVKPTEDRIVIHPVSLVPIKPEGEIVYQCPQIKRYLKFGDLVKVEETKKIVKKITTNKTGE